MSIIAHPEVFSTDPYIYTPSELKARTREVSMLARATTQFAETNQPSLLLVSGVKASGKTITIIKFIRDQKPSSDIRSIILKPESTMRDALANSGIPEFNGQEIPRTLSGVIHLLVEQLQEHKRGKLCLFIDDAQRYAWTDLNDALRFLYEHGKNTILPALSFNIPIEQMRQRIQLDVQSRYAWGSGTFPIGFHAYIFQEMYDILLQRAEEGLKKDAWTQGAIHEAAVHGQSVGDVRQAISMLYAAAKKIKTGKLGKDEMLNAVEEGNLLTLTEDVNNLSIMHRLYLLAVTLTHRKTPEASTHGIGAQIAEALYEKICKIIEIPPVTSPATRWRIRKVLQFEAGLIENEYHPYLITTTDGIARRGATSIIKLKPDTDLLLKALKRTEWGEYNEEPSFQKLFEI